MQVLELIYPTDLRKSDAARQRGDRWATAGESCGRCHMSQRGALGRSRRMAITIRLGQENGNVTLGARWEGGGGCACLLSASWGATLFQWF